MALLVLAVGGALAAEGEPAVGATPGDRAVVERALEDADPELRAAAVLGMAAYGAVVARPIFERAMTDPEQLVRLAAVEGVTYLVRRVTRTTFGYVYDETLGPVLEAALIDESLTVAVQAGQLLVKVEKWALLPPLFAQLERQLTEGTYSERLEAVEHIASFSRLPDLPEATRLLERAAHDDVSGRVRDIAEAALSAQ